jgi:stalled ribosome alternative rescue factor ArfA
MGSMAFRSSCRLPMLVKSALMRSRIEQNRRRLCVS